VWVHRVLMAGSWWLPGGLVCRRREPPEDASGSHIIQVSLASNTNGASSALSLARGSGQLKREEYKQMLIEQFVRTPSSALHKHTHTHFILPYSMAGIPLVLTPIL
jgi:hypothetical protein